MKESFLLRNYYGRRQDKNIGSADHTEYDKRIEPTLQHIASGKMPVKGLVEQCDQAHQAEEWNLSEAEDCSSSVIPHLENSGNLENGKKKVIVSDPVSMKKYLFDNYRLSMYTFLNKCRRNGTISNIIGQRVLNSVFNRDAVKFTDVTFWRIDRENFWADISVELKLTTRDGSFPWNCIIETWCSFEGDSFFISFESLSTSVDRRGFDLLSPFLVPYFTTQKVDEITQELLYRYTPSALHESEKRNAVKLAEKMGLKVEYYDIYEHQEVRGIIFFADDELRVGADRFETDEDGRKRRIKDEKPGLVKIPAGTIVINTNKINCDYSEFHIYHECIHNEFHYLFFRLQQMGSNDPRKMKTKEIIVGKNEEVTDAMFFIEKQANRGAYGLMMPVTDTKDRIYAEKGKIERKERTERTENGGHKHLGEIYESVGKALSTALHLPHFHIRARMIQLGFIEAKGALNYVERKLIRPFAFNVDSWRESEHTYVVDRGSVIGICRNNADLRTIMENGNYVYAEGHVVRNKPKFVKKEENKYVLTDFAITHIDDCCLRFVRQYKQENIGQFVFGKMYYDAEYVKQTLFYLSDIMNREQLDELDAKIDYVENFPRTFVKAFDMIMKQNGESREGVAYRLHTSDNTLREWLYNPEGRIKLDFIGGIHRMCG